MSDWQTVISIVSGIIGVGFLITKPVLSLTKALTEVKDSCQSLGEQFKSFKTDNSESHRRIWDDLDHKGEVLQVHNQLLIQHSNRLRDLDGKEDLK